MAFSYLNRLDEKDESAFRWILISWSPDSSSVRNKMLYASTKATLKQEFGGGQVKDDLYGNVRVRGGALVKVIVETPYFLFNFVT